MKTVQIGIIGLGYIGQTHLHNALRLPNARVIAVADVSKKALRIAKDAGVESAFTNYEDLLKRSEIDAVVIALPTHFHAQCAKRAAESKKHVLLEKPIARTIDEGREIVETAEKNSIRLMIGYPARFASEFRMLKQQIDNRDLGDVEIAYGTHISSGPFFHRAEGYAPVPVPEWWFDKALTGGGALLDVGCHLINLLRWYFGHVTDIKSNLGYRFNMDFEDSASCLMKFASGTKALITVGWFSQQTQVKVELFGTAKCVEARLQTQSPLVTALQLMITGTSRFNQPLVTELSYFIDCILRDLKPSPSGEDGLGDLMTIHQAYANQIKLG